MAKRRFQIDQLIVNSYYEEPSTYWSYDWEVRMFERKDGRRPAEYVVAKDGAVHPAMSTSATRFPVVFSQRRTTTG